MSKTEVACTDRITHFVCLVRTCPEKNFVNEMIGQEIVIFTEFA